MYWARRAAACSSPAISLILIWQTINSTRYSFPNQPPHNKVLKSADETQSSTEATTDLTKTWLLVFSLYATFADTIHARCYSTRRDASCIAKITACEALGGMYGNTTFAMFQDNNCFCLISHKSSNCKTIRHIATNQSDFDRRSMPTKPESFQIT